jgi:hypothetical protein
LPDPVVTLADFRLGLEVEYLCPKNFLFEPGLEPGISQRTLVELRVRNIRLIYFTTGARECRPTEQQDTPPLIRFYGFDQSIECPSAK